MAKDSRPRTVPIERTEAHNNDVKPQTSEPRQKTAKAEVVKAPKLTVQLSYELDFVLSNLARINKRRKKDFVLHLLDTGCRKYGPYESLKNVFAAIHRQTGEAA